MRDVIESLKGENKSCAKSIQAPVMNTTSGWPDSVSMVNMTPLDAKLLRTICITATEGETLNLDSSVDRLVSSKSSYGH